MSNEPSSRPLAYILSLACMLIGCSEHAHDAVTPSDATAYKSVKISVVLVKGGKTTRKERQISKTAEIERLLKFFPDLGKEKKSPIAGGWIAMVTCEFEKKNSSKIVVISDFKDWSERHGDWPLKPGFEKTINELVE